MSAHRLTTPVGVRLVLGAVLGGVVLLVALLMAAAPARAAFGITTFDGEVLQQDGSVASQAGAHPFSASTSIAITARPLGPAQAIIPYENLRDVQVNLPPGLIGNPTVVEQCTSSQLTAFGSLGLGPASCPVDSQVGMVQFISALIPFPLRASLFSMVPPPGVPAAFGFIFAGTKVMLYARVRPDRDYALTIESPDTPEALALSSTRVELWGIPADASHDQDRGYDSANDRYFSSSSPRRALLTNPTMCTPAGIGLKTELSATSWPGSSASASFMSHLPAPDQDQQIGPTDCDKLPFLPTIDARPDTSTPDAPTGLSVDLAFPQESITDPDALATAHLKAARVTLPDGMTINPAGAGGLQACTDAQLKLKTDEPLECPAASKIGTATATTPLLKESLSGGVYIRSQNSMDPESGDMFRIALVLENEQRGVDVRLPGSIFVNEDTGQIETVFDNNPQVPVSHIELRLKSGPRAALATPNSCGEKAIDSVLTSWSDKTVNRRSTFGIACTPGLGGFAPSFSAGTDNPSAGAPSPFTLRVDKPDGQSDLNGVTLSMPEGLLAKLKGNLGTQIGTARVGAGPGPNPFSLAGPVVLEGPYGDAPFSLRVTIPAVAGPFNLGDVVVRQKIYVDPITARVQVVSDPLPTIVKGVPVRLQNLAVDIDKPDFTINPTSCAPKAIEAALHSATDAIAAESVHFQVGNCAALALKPSLTLSLRGKGQTTDGKHPAVTANLTQPAGEQANLKKVRVALPLSLALDPDNANGLCEFVDGSKAEPTCPEASIVGTATAVTPILDQPLSGPVYFVKNIRKDPKSGREIRTLPKLVIPLVGQNGVKLTLTGTSNVEDDQLVTTFDNIPDAPVSSFKLNIIGGKGGILTVSGADICKATQIADQQIDGQNNKNADADVYIQTPSCPVKIISKNIMAKSVALKVGGLGAGKVTVTGRGIKKTTKTIAKSTVAMITARRTKGAPGRVTVSFDPAGPAKARKVIR